MKPTGLRFVESCAMCKHLIQCNYWNYCDKHGEKLLHLSCICDDYMSEYRLRNDFQ